MFHAGKLLSIRKNSGNLPKSEEIQCEPPRPGLGAGQPAGDAQLHWRDQEHKKFADQFDAHMKVLVRFTEEADQYVPYLIRKAAHIEDYLQS